MNLGLWRGRIYGVFLVVGLLCSPATSAVSRDPGAAEAGNAGSGRAGVSIGHSLESSRPAGANQPAQHESANSAPTSPSPWGVPDEAIEEFLRTAQVVEVKVIKSGITKPLRLTLSLNGVSRNAIFRHVRIYRPRARTVDGLRLDFRDSAVFECAAYRLARLLGIDHVPPTVVREFTEKDFRDSAQLRRFPVREGSLQAWLEGAMTEKDRRDDSLHSPYGLLWMRQFQEMWLFDALIFNEDRNQGNILIDSDWKVWFIDATRAFRPFKELRNPHRLVLCGRETWERLREVTDEEIEQVMDGLLSGAELRALIERRHQLVKHLEGLIRERGEESVLFDHDASRPGSVRQELSSEGAYPGPGQVGGAEGR